MELLKAIEVLELNYLVPKKPRDHDFQDAIKLGIEALKRLQTIRGYPHYQWKQLLPGETED